MRPRVWMGLGALALVLAFALAFAPPAWAARDATMQACRADYGKLCAGIQPGGGRVAECLQGHAAELTPACKAAMDQLGNCGQEVKRICGDASGTGAVRACMKAHADEFSAHCRPAAAGQ